MNYILILLLGLIIGYFTGIILIIKHFLAGTLSVDETDPMDVKMGIVADKDLDEVAKNSYVLFKVVHKKSQNNVPL